MASAPGQARAQDLATRATVAIITALPEELAAMKKMLHSPVEYSAPGRFPGEYWLGEVPAKGNGKHVVVLVRSGAGENPATARTAIMLERFPHINAVLMVGIASDLLGYAQIYRDHLDVVKHDKKHYRATDLADATKAAESILKTLGDALSPEGKDASDNLARAWTLLLTLYGEVSATGRWLERKEKGLDKLYPSLFGAGRPGGGRPRKKEDAKDKDKQPSGG